MNINNTLMRLIKVIKLFGAAILILFFINSCKKELLQPESRSTKSSLEKEWLTVSDPRWLPFMLDKAKQDNPKASVKDLTQLFIRNTIVLGKAQNAIKKELLLLGYTVAELNSLDSIHKLSVYSMFKDDPNYKPIPLDTAKWNRYLALALPKRQGKIMSGSFDGDITITACAIPSELQMFAGSPDVVREMAMMYMGSSNPVHLCRYRALRDLDALYEQLYFGSGTSYSCGQLTQMIYGELACYYACDQPGNPNPGSEPGTDPGSGGGTDGGGGGGGSGSISVSNTTPRDTIVQIKFRQNIKTRCALDRLMQNESYKKAINNFIGENQPIDLTFRLENIFEPGGYIILGQTTPNPASWNARNIFLTVNESRLPNMSSLEVALLLVHEGLHAEIFRKLMSIGDPANLSDKNFPELFNIYLEYNIEKGFQHEVIARKYVNEIARTLETFDNHKFPRSYYDALAWTGLEGTVAFSLKSPLEWTAIYNSTEALLSGRSLNGCTDAN